MFHSQEQFDELQDEFFSDNRIRGCRRHPGEVTSNGMFDAPCGGCESEMDAADADDAA